MPGKDPPMTAPNRSNSFFSAALADVDPEIADAVEQAVKVFEEMGAIIEEVTPAWGPLGPELAQLNRSCETRPGKDKRPRLSDLRPPEGAQPMAGFSIAVERLRKAVVDGDVENGSVMAGQSVGLVDKVQPMREIVAELVREAEIFLAKL